MTHIIERPTTKRRTADLYSILWVVLMFLFCIGYILDKTEEQEPRKVHSIFKYRGHIVNGYPVSVNEHCEK